ncbi:MAG: GEVED domain-containing protein, partial [Chloroflexota bacterium]
RVWIDNGAGGGTANDGNYSDGEPTVPNVTVNLFNSFDVNGIPTDPDNPFRTVQTDANGFYRFDNIPPDEYVVQIDESEFAAGGDLAGFSSSPGAPGGDNADNGRDDTNPNTQGVLSNVVDMRTTATLPTNEQSSDATAPDATGNDPSGNPIPDPQSNLAVDFGFVEAFDWGDAPDTYGTDSDTTTDTGGDSLQVGANHRIVAGLRLGTDVDDESSGAPVTAGANNNAGFGDGAVNRDDEEGFDPTTRLVAGTDVQIEVNVVNTTGSPANLIAWFDWNQNGVFEDNEATPVLSVPTGTNGLVTLPQFTIPASANSTGSAVNTYARFRLTNDTIDATEPTGNKTSGEVEDYQVSVQPPGLSISKTDGQNSVVAGQTTTYTITIQNSGVNERNDVRFVDDIPVADGANRDGLVGGTISWTCTATNGASCVNRADPVNDPPVTSGNGTVAAEAGVGNFEIDERIDLPPGGVIVYEITGQLDSQAGQTGGTNFVNTASLPQEVPPIEASDDNGIIFDPPSGVKTGTVQDNNVIRWTMIWYNTGTTQPGVTIEDTLRANQTLAANDADVNLQCTNNTPGGTTGGCTISADRSTITWNGTMANSSVADPTDAVIISFNVLVPGAGTYENIATLTGFPAPNTVVTAASVVTIDDPDNPSDDSSSPGPEVLDPAIVKLVDPALALPGENVTWTVTVTNPNPGPLFGVSFSDNMPFQLEILSVEADTGDVVVSGNNVTWTAAIMPAGQSVTVRIFTRLRTDVPNDTPIIINTAVLNTGLTAQAELLTVLELPATGETPWWREDLHLILLVSGSTVAMFWWFVSKTRRQRQV